MVLAASPRLSICRTCCACRGSSMSPVSCDPSAKTRGFVAQRYGLTTFPTVDQLFQQPLDAVLVASPDPLHKEHVLAGLGNGLHVFCEKPLCYSSADIAELIAARDRAGTRLAGRLHEALRPFLRGVAGAACRAVRRPSGRSPSKCTTPMPGRSFATTTDVPSRRRAAELIADTARKAAAAGGAGGPAFARCAVGSTWLLQRLLLLAWCMM